MQEEWKYRNDVIGMDLRPNSVRLARSVLLDSTGSLKKVFHGQDWSKAHLSLPPSQFSVDVT